MEPARSSRPSRRAADASQVPNAGPCKGGGACALLCTAPTGCTPCAAPRAHARAWPAHRAAQQAWVGLGWLDPTPRSAARTYLRAG